MDDQPEKTARQRHRESYKAAHPDTYRAEKRRTMARARQTRAVREALDPTLRAARLAERKAYNEATKEARAAYMKAYKARKRAARMAGVGGVGQPT